MKYSSNKVVNHHLDRIIHLQSRFMVETTGNIYAQKIYAPLAVQIPTTFVEASFSRVTVLNGNANERQVREATAYT